MISAAGNKIFGIGFVKRTTGEKRTMSVRRNVTKGVTGAGMSYDPASKGLVVVYDMDGKHKTIPVDGLFHLKMDKVTYDVV